VVVTPTSGWFSGVGGVAFLGSFTWGDDTPCFVFPDRLGYFPKYVAECCSHETGHALGLSHQSRYDAGCNLAATYHEGAGLGESSWAPIMGNSYYRNMSGWNNGPTPFGCNSNQDNLSIITSQNGFGYRTDDHADDLNSNPSLLDISSFSVNGIISTSSDKDCFRFNLAENANVLLNINPYQVGGNADGANLDIKISLYNASRSLIRTYDRSDRLSVAIDTVLQSGTYFLMVDGTGNQNASDYGSLGSYSIEGIARILPIRSVTLNGSLTGNLVHLDWETISDNPIQKTVIEYSANGQDFTAWQDVEANISQYSGNHPLTGRRGFFRLKVVGTDNQWKYSNTVTVQNNQTALGGFTLLPAGANRFMIEGSGQYSFAVYQSGGKLVSLTNRVNGRQWIDLAGQPAGIYLVRMFGETGVQTERVLVGR
jgi:hypothetical protein